MPETLTAATDADVEPLEEFRQRLRSWLKANVGPTRPMHHADTDEQELAALAHSRELQRRFYDAGFAGLIFPKEYGGAGLTPAHQQVMNEEIRGYDFPRFQVPTFSPCASVILECGTEEQKLRHLPPIMRGEEIWMQFLSEPGGGSDVAGAQTTATRDGDAWVLNGSKIWTSGAWYSDWALCLARTNWDVPKHEGLTVFMLPIQQPGIEIHRIEMLNGTNDFCQEFLTDVAVPDSDRVGAVDDGWTVGTRWMYHEKSLGSSSYMIRPAGTLRGMSDGAQATTSLAESVGRLDDSVGRQLVGEAHMLKTVGTELSTRIGQGIALGRYNEQAAAMSRIATGSFSVRIATINFELAGPTAAVWHEDEATMGQRGLDYLVRQSRTLGGGTIEMSRNGVSERLLGMPKEPRADKGVAFRDVPRSR
jgi:alkylation response protein AidB-like acyl-CoA dehydrogenase